MSRFFRNNSLSIIFLLLLFLAMIGQIIAGFNEHNEERKENGMTGLGLATYLTSYYPFFYDKKDRPNPSLWMHPIQKPGNRIFITFFYI